MTPPGPAAAGFAWWQEAVFYQVYPRSFCLADPDGRRTRLAADPGAGACSAGPRSGAPDRLRDGAGDLEGIRQHLDHLAWLGVDALWLSPFQPSPMKDFGYDVADYCDVDPLFGTLDDFDRLLADAHARGLRLIVDWVPNHTSDRHPWFAESRSSRTSARRDWYVWRDGRGTAGELPPNNWRAAFDAGPAWTFDEETGQWYLHLFLPEQPDLNWSNPAVRDAMWRVLRFWLDRGVDGFRIDVVHGLGKDPALPDAPPERAHIPWSSQNDDPATFEILAHLRSLLDSRPGDPVAVGEVFLLDTEKVAGYCGPGKLHLGFDFTTMYCSFDAVCLRSRIEEAERLVAGRGGWPTWVLSNHDRPRARTRYGSEQAARAAAVLLLTLRGTPFLFAGEELGLEDAQVPPEAVVDPGGRDGCRAPIPWDESPDHGWALGGGTPWLPWPQSPDTQNISAERQDRRSFLDLYRRLLGLRRSSPALRRGSITLLEGHPDVVAYERRFEEECLVVAVNCAREERPSPAPPGSRVVLSSRSTSAGAHSVALAPEEAVVVSGD